MDASRRVAELRGYMEERGLSACLVKDPDNQYYLSGFKAIIYSRPIDLVITMERTILIVPGLEEAHAASEAGVDEVLVYYEHPEKADLGKSHLEHLDKVLSSLAPASKLGIEEGSASFALASHLAKGGFELVDVGARIKTMRFVKDQAEIDLMLEAGRLVSLAVAASLSALTSGITEMELDAHGNSAVFAEVAAKHPGATLDLFAMSPSGSVRTVMPHVFSNTRRIEQGDVLIHSRQVAINGYRGECERTCFVGKPTPQQERAFMVVMESQQAGIDALKAGTPMCEVDRAARDVIQKAGLGEYFIHRTGHGLGISTHEEPSLRFDEGMLVEEGMVFSIEPAIFVPGLGGFRHSDTVLVTAEGNRLTTEYPRDLRSLIF